MARASPQGHLADDLGFGKADSFVFGVQHVGQPLLGDGEHHSSLLLARVVEDHFVEVEQGFLSTVSFDEEKQRVNQVARREG